MILFLSEKAPTDEGREKRDSPEHWIFFFCFQDPKAVGCIDFYLTNQR